MTYIPTIICVWLLLDYFIHRHHADHLIPYILAVGYATYFMAEHGVSVFWMLILYTGLMRALLYMFAFDPEDTAGRLYFHKRYGLLALLSSTWVSGLAALVMLIL